MSSVSIILVGIAAMIVLIVVTTISMLCERQYVRKTNELWGRFADLFGGEFVPNSMLHNEGPSVHPSSLDAWHG